MKIIRKSILSVCLLFGMVVTANATLIGDDVTAQHYYNQVGSAYANLATATVSADSSDLLKPINGSYYTVDVSADSFFVDYINQATWSIGPFNGVLVDSLNDSTGNDLQGVSVTTNMVGWDDSRLTFDMDSVWLNWNGLSFNSNTFFDVSMDFGAEPVPEPATMILLGTGLLGFAVVRKRKK